MIDPLLEPRPAIEGERVAALLSDLYGIDGNLTQLHGERDLNFKVDSTDGGRYVLKIHNPSDPHGVVEMHASAIAHARRVDGTLPLPRLVLTSAGAAGAQVVGPDGRCSEVELFTFLEGHHATREELGERALFEWGGCVARLGRALRGFFHPAAGYRIQWDLRHTGALRDRLYLIDGETRELVAQAIDRFAANVEPRFEALRAQFVHDDMHRENVLVDDHQEIVGITDFGDATHTALVCDLAVALADVLNGRSDSLDMAEVMIAGYGACTPLEPIEARVLGDLVAARAATDVVVTTWRRRHHPHATERPTGSIELLRIFREGGFSEVTIRLEHAARGAANGRIRSPSYSHRPSAELLASRKEVLGPLELSYDEPLHLVRGEGVHLFDADGRRYIDAYNNVPVVGHCHPYVTAAVTAQADLLVTNTRYLHGAIVELAERLLAHAPGRLERVLFVNSGSEANDVVWRMARMATGRDGALVTRFAYHGVTQATTDLSPEEWPEGHSPAHVGLLAPPGASRGDSVEVLDALASNGHLPAALYVEPAFISDGVLGPAHDWIAETAAVVHSAGGLVVA
ncbi:MAG: aminotransferase class III-fold pyridoxal phosphate-dependent enzyme, partial [Acidimicrobiales bacterium]